ncbi:MAG TPA: DUF1028 domain-containing protein [Candidatus Dormibacteraeota bacterium]|nr:DUF1028 domain-containing protein [Candidatus Dormibacteraeota bacterium]
MTYSIVARDPKTGELGVAVQSHYFQVSPAVPWALAGVGAVATQSQVNLSFGPLGLELMQAGHRAEQALRALVAGDPQAEMRQCGIVDAAGGVAAHTGSKCIPAAGHHLGDGFTCQANLMEKDTVWAAMAHAYTTSGAPLPERMMAALEAAEAEGGDIRGKQSAAMLVVTGSPTGRPWDDRIIDLRVEDAAEPLAELRRLLRIKRAYMTLGDADRLSDSGDKRAANAKAEEAIRIAPEMAEIRFWTGLEMATNGDMDGGCVLMAAVVREKGERWIEMLRRLAMVDRVAPETARAIEARLISAVASK